MRLFTGISVENLTQAWADLRRGLHLKWTPDANLHITTKFIGEWPEARLPELQNELGRIGRPANIPVTISGLGFLPGAKIFYAGVQAGQGLAELAHATEDAVEPLGCKREDRPYFPHLTLARVSGREVQTLHERIASMRTFDFGSFEATEFHLFLSRNGVYSKLASYRLA